MNENDVIDICCGSGFLSLAFEREGFNIKMGIDNNKYCISSYQKNFINSMVLEIDILDINKLPNCGIIIGGPPCQNISKANRDPDHKKALILINKFIDLVKKSNVKYWILENVPPVMNYIKNKVPRVEIFNCYEFGAKNLRPRLFAGNYPDPVPVMKPFKNPLKTVLATESILSIDEMKDLMGVPHWFNLVGNEKEIRKQIGNAVPLPMGQALARGIKWHIEGRFKKNHQYWHKTSQLTHRELGGKRAYLKIENWVYCEICKRPIYQK